MSTKTEATVLVAGADGNGNPRRMASVELREDTFPYTN